MAYPAAYKKAKKKAVAKKKATARKSPVKKKRTAKQIAATKRLVAANKARAKKRVGTSTRKKSMTTGKAPTKRLKKRRAANTKPGYYPNPRKKTTRKKWRVLCVVPSAAGINSGIDPNKTGYWTGTGWDTRKDKAVRYPNLEAARNEAAHLPKKYRSGMYWSYATETV